MKYESVLWVSLHLYNVKPSNIMTHIQPSDSHQPILNTATALGSWLLTLNGLSQQDRAVIQSVQSALLTLPTLKEDTLAMYGFSI